MGENVLRKRSNRQRVMGVAGCDADLGKTGEPDMGPDDESGTTLPSNAKVAAGRAAEAVASRDVTATGQVSFAKFFAFSPFSRASPPQ